MCCCPAESWRQGRALQVYHCGCSSAGQPSVSLTAGLDRVQNLMLYAGASPGPSLGPSNPSLSGRMSSWLCAPLTQPRYLVCLTHREPQRCQILWPAVAAAAAAAAAGARGLGTGPTAGQPRATLGPSGQGEPTSHSGTSVRR
ncbi:unnamed protein product [Gadus morhua 'NCC']